MREVQRPALTVLIKFSAKEAVGCIPASETQTVYLFSATFMFKQSLINMWLSHLLALDSVKVCVDEKCDGVLEKVLHINNGLQETEHMAIYHV